MVRLALISAAFLMRLLKLTSQSEEYIFKVLLAMSFILSVVRLSQFLQLHPSIGPKISMITNMFVDLFFFVSIVFIFLIGYGVGTESLIFPNERNLTSETVFELLWRPYVHLFGSLDLTPLQRTIETEYCKLKNSEITNEYNKCGSNNSTYNCSADPICRYNFIIVKFCLGMYMMFAVVMMLNLLIAVFNNTYQMLNAKANELCKWQRYELLEEFRQYYALPFPISSLTYITRTCKWIWKQICGRRKHFLNREKTKRRDEYIDYTIAMVENECKRNFLKNSAIINDDS